MDLYVFPSSYGVVVTVILSFFNSFFIPFRSHSCDETGLLSFPCLNSRHPTRAQQVSEHGGINVLGGQTTHSRKAYTGVAG